ncbi:hypothetical protein [Spongiimicrobium sp. 3-5]|uniref:hypothetical protein n=1 Tax=Spongiimicrobium sp. 3-5 TaxID=3332596 RepID=UPI00398021DD
MMKKMISFVAILAIIFASNCSRIPENNDPVIGIWTNETIGSNSLTEKQTARKEWIFNDAYLGRFHSYTNKQLEMKTDFSWTQEDGVYTISYPGTDLLDDIVTLQKAEDGTVLKDNQGNTLAVRE